MMDDILDDGKLYTFGRTGARLGYVTTARKQQTPKVVDGLAGHHVIKVACGVDFTLGNKFFNLFTFFFLFFRRFIQCLSLLIK